MKTVVKQTTAVRGGNSRRAIILCGESIPCTEFLARNTFARAENQIREKPKNPSRFSTSNCNRLLYRGQFISLLLAVLCYAQAGQAVQLANVSFEDMLRMDLKDLISTSYTAARRQTTIEDSPSIITIIGEDVIRRRGYKSLYEVLAQIPGFFNSPSPFTESISNRGFVQNVNTNYLLLIDGHAMNHIGARGIATDHMMPGLDRVKQIEVMRAPSSTLWGSDANTGVIQIITKDAAGVVPQGRKQGLHVSLDHETESARHIAQLNYGYSKGNTNAFLALNAFTSNPDWARSFVPGETDYRLQTDRVINYWDFDNSYNLYSKWDYGNVSIKAGTQRFKALSPLFSDLENLQESLFISDKDWLDFRFKKSLSDHWEFRSKIYYDNYTQRRITRFSKDVVTSLTEDRRRREQVYAEGIGGELLFFYQADRRSATFGLFADRKKYSNPWVDVDASTGDYIVNGEFTPAFTDRNSAVFFEDNYSGIDNWTVIYGARVAQNKPRDEASTVMPRFSLVYGPDKNWRLHYAFNTGYVRPTATQSRGGGEPIPLQAATVLIKGADDSQTSKMHELNFSYKKDDFNFQSTLFYGEITDVIQFVGFGAGAVEINGQQVILFETNVSDFATKGIELEADYTLKQRYKIYGHYSYTESRYLHSHPVLDGGLVFDIVNRSTVADEDLRVTGVPRHIWNIGLDWDVNKDLFFNINLRGWSDIVTKRSNIPGFERYGSESYLNMALSKNILNSKGALSFYAKNLLDNNNRIPDGVNGGYIENPLRRQLGVNFQYHF